MQLDEISSFLVNFELFSFVFVCVFRSFVFTAAFCFDLLSIFLFLINCHLKQVQL